MKWESVAIGLKNDLSPLPLQPIRVKIAISLENPGALVLKGACTFGEEVEVKVRLVFQTNAFTEEMRSNYVEVILAYIVSLIPN